MSVVMAFFIMWSTLTTKSEHNVIHMEPMYIIAYQSNVEFLEMEPLFITIKQ